MAVPGQKLSDFSGSLSQGSEEDFDICCDPCLTTDKHIGAHKYCLDCREYLCKNCSDCHLKTKASRNHRLVDKDNIGKQHTFKDTEVFTETCPEHKQEVIKYYCPRHEALGCHDCVIMHHRTCDIDYIPEKCAGIAHSEEYRQTMQKLDQKLQELDGITNGAKGRDKDIDTCYDNLIKEIVKFRKEINDRLDQLQQKFQNEADKKKTADKQIIQIILDRCDSLSSDIKKLQSNLEANTTSCQNGQLYITVKQAQSSLKSDEIKQAEDGFERTRMQNTFELNSSLQKMLTNEDILGKLSLSVVLNTPRKKQVFIKLTKTGIVVLNHRDCFISGCAVLSSDKHVLADDANDKLIVLNTQSKTLVEEKSLDSNPWDIAVLPQDQIAVTMPLKREVRIMTTAGKLSTVRTVSVKALCRGVIYHQDHLYVVSEDPLCVLILNKKGKHQKTIYLSSETFSKPRYLVLSDDSKLIYISDYKKDCVVSITLQGEVTAVYKSNTLIEPAGMLVLDDGSLLVCSSDYTFSGNIQHISGDLKEGKIATDDVMFPRSICYNRHHNEIYIGSSEIFWLTVLSP